MSVYNLVYVSTARMDLNGDGDPAAVDSILATARRRNADVDVTGALLFTEGKFVQALEGARVDVHATFDRISADPRHSDVEVLSAQYSDRRRFKDWSMAFVGGSETLRARFADAPLAALGRRPAGDALLDYMLELAQSCDDPELALPGPVGKFIADPKM